MKKLMFLFLFVANMAFGQVHYDSTARMPYVNVSRVYYRVTDLVPASRVYFHLVGFDFVGSVQLEYFVKDTTNYNVVFTGVSTFALPSRNIDTAAAVMISSLINSKLVDYNGTPVLTILP